MKRFLTVFALSWLMSVPAFAAFSYELAFSQTNVSVATGQNFTLDVLFRETVTGTDTHRLDLAGGTFGLTTANFSVGNNGLGGSLLTGIDGNALFDFGGGPTTSPGDPSASVAQDIGVFSDPVFATVETPVVGGTTRSVRVGSLTLTASNTLGDVNVFQLSDFSTGDDFVIDGGLFNAPFVADAGMTFGSVSVTAVPEPGSIAVLAMLGGLGAYRHRRRKMAKEAALAA